MPREEKILTAGELLRRRAQKKNCAASSSDEEDDRTNCQEAPSGDIDDEIKRLEAELAKEQSSSTSASSSSDDDDDNDSNDDDDASAEHNTKSSAASAAALTKQDSGAAVLSLSAIDKEDRIESLPSHLLPAARKRKLKIDGRDEREKKAKTDDGLTSAVKEVLSGYVARSAEKLPNYCRYCQKQYPNETEFFAHKASEFHQRAVEVERKASYCKLCRKQLTSPEQLKEHVTSRPHKERLDYMQSKNPAGRGRGFGRDDRVRGRGYQGRGFHGRGFQGRGRGPTTSSRGNWAR